MTEAHFIAALCLALVAFPLAFAGAVWAVVALVRYSD